MVTKKDILEIKRRYKKDECTFQRLCGCYVDSQRNKVTTFSEAFLNLEDEEFYKYLDIAKKALSGTLGNNILELPFPLASEEGGMQQYFMGLRASELKNEELLDRLYDRIIDGYDYAGNYLILLFYDVYDVPTKTNDNLKLDESEEMFPYILAAICPVKLSKPGLGYLEQDNRIGSRIRDWVVDMPEVGFMFPSFAERSADIHTITYYVKDPKDSKSSFVQSVLEVDPKRTTTEQRLTFHAIVKKAIAPVVGEDDTLLINIQESLQDKIPMSMDSADEASLDLDAPLTSELIAEVLSENAVPDRISQEIQESFKEVFEDEKSEIPAIAAVIDDKKLTAVKKEKHEAELESQVIELKQELVNKTFEAVAAADTTLNEDSGFSQTYDVILRVKPDKVPLIHTDTVEGKRCVVIPLADDEYINLNGVNTKL